ncbi:RmlC-like cupins superfamily protein [Actinidia rufa]|uniref:RmlC-like cupins superfamily protein n=1 Tax=Actinidia rufa TaxID=165716 RepID=A0A7J0EMD1_9ERIC|nr:RmlC-like cupins superfamily protein [Actinidia rufa]
MENSARTQSLRKRRISSFQASYATKHIKPSPVGSIVTPANVAQIPGLNTLGISMVRIDYAPYGQNPPHTHPRASEILVVLEGSLYVGFVTSNPDNRLFTKVLYPGEAFVFPEELIDFQFNMGKTNAVALAALSSQNPGVITIANAVFRSDPKISADVLTKAFQVDKKVGQQLNMAFLCLCLNNNEGGPVESGEGKGSQRQQWSKPWADIVKEHSKPQMKLEYRPRDLGSRLHLALLTFLFSVRKRWGVLRAEYQTLPLAQVVLLDAGEGEVEEGEAEHIAESGLINLEDVTVLGEIPVEESPEPDKVEFVVKIQVQTGIAE